MKKFEMFAYWSPFGGGAVRAREEGGAVVCHMEIE